MSQDGEKKKIQERFDFKDFKEQSGEENTLTAQFPKCSCVSNVKILKILAGDISLILQNPKLENKVSSKSRY